MRDEKGRFMKGSEGFTGRHSEESKKLMSKSHKGHIAWNKGKTKKEFPQLSNSGQQDWGNVASASHQAVC